MIFGITLNQIGMNSYSYVRPIATVNHFTMITGLEQRLTLLDHANTIFKVMSLASSLICKTLPVFL